MALVPDKKEAIIRASVELFAERGFSDTPTSAIARRAKVAEGTIFHYFHAKQEILDHIIGHILGLYLEGTEKAKADAANGFDEVLNLITLHFRLADTNPLEFIVVLRDLPPTAGDGTPRVNPSINERAEKMFSRYKSAIERGMADGSIRELPVAATASVIIGMVIGMLRQQFFSPRKICDMKSLRAEALSFCARSIGTDKR